MYYYVPFFLFMSGEGAFYNNKVFYIFHIKIPALSYQMILINIPLIL